MVVDMRMHRHDFTRALCTVILSWVVSFGFSFAADASNELSELKRRVSKIEKEIVTTSKITRDPSDTRLIEAQKRRNDALYSQNWAQYTDASLDIAMILGDWFPARSHIIYGLIRQGRYDAAKYVNEEIYQFDSKQPVVRHKSAKFETFRDDEEANILAAQGRCAEADAIFKGVIERNLACDSELDLHEARLNYSVCLRQQGRNAEAVKVELAMDGKHCPVCHNDDNVVPIRYGLPAGPVPDDVVLGGCLVNETSPHWWCKSDKTAF
jgi:tetratricopeptide (TPR) repeat protein